MARYGVGITTRNRPAVLRAALAHFAHYCPTVSAHSGDNGDVEYVIVDDASDDDSENRRAVEAFMRDAMADVEYRHSDRRLGIAGAKDACLARLTGCDHVFLFDDDAWPRCDGWADRWTDTTDAVGVEHSMWLDPGDLGAGDIFQIEATGRATGDWVVNFWTNCMGVVLHFTRGCLAALGGYGPTPNVYGYEHAVMSRRAMLAGFTRGFKYPAPANCADLVYSVDVSWGIKHEPCPLPEFETDLAAVFRSSVPEDEKAAASLNSGLLGTTTVYVPLVDPLA
jgi:glycosyltransferase involved in cell wall biosynthesis